MDHSAHFYTSRPLLVDWLYRIVRAGMQTGDMCVVIARPDIRATLERLLDLDFDVTAAAAWGLYAYVDTGDLIGEPDRAPGSDASEFTAWLGGVAAGAEAAGRRVAIWSELADVLRQSGDASAGQQVEDLWDAAPGAVRSVTCLYARPPRGVRGEKDWVDAVRTIHGSR